MADWKAAALRAVVLIHHAVSSVFSQPPARFLRSTVRETMATRWTSGCQPSGN
jgi:hypothetical protein